MKEIAHAIAFAAATYSLAVALYWIGLTELWSLD